MLDFVCFSVNFWEKRWDRKHNFMFSLSRKECVGKVVYVEPAMNLIRLLLFPRAEIGSPEGMERWKRALSFGFSELNDKLILFTPLFVLPLWRFYPIYKIDRFMNVIILKSKLRSLGIREPVLWFYHPYDACVLDYWKDRKAACFDWAELWSEWFVEFSPKRLKFVAELEERMIRGCDLVFTVSQELTRRARRWNPNSHFLASGASLEMFEGIGKDDIPEDIERIPQPIVGYVGTIGERVDVELLYKISRRFPKASLVLVGRVLKDRIDPEVLEGLKARDNVYFLGEREYRELPGYIAAFKVGIIPYIPERIKLNEPTKHYDYLAAGKPVVSTAIEELLRFKDYIYIARSHEEFLELLDRALNEDDPERARKRLRFMEGNTWSVRADEILENLRKFITLKNSSLDTFWGR